MVTIISGHILQELQFVYRYESDVK